MGWWDKVGHNEAGNRNPGWVTTTFLGFIAEFSPKISTYPRDDFSFLFAPKRVVSIACKNKKVKVKVRSKSKMSKYCRLKEALGYFQQCSVDCAVCNVQYIRNIADLTLKHF